MAVTASTPIELVERVYGSLPERVFVGRERLGRPLTLTEKILINHLSDPTVFSLLSALSALSAGPPASPPCSRSVSGWAACRRLAPRPALRRR